MVSLRVLLRKSPRSAIASESAVYRVVHAETERTKQAGTAVIGLPKQNSIDEDPRNGRRASLLSLPI
jgi:hypothetical protein